MAKLYAIRFRSPTSSQELIELPGQDLAEVVIDELFAIKRGESLIETEGWVSIHQDEDRTRPVAIIYGDGSFSVGVSALTV